MLFDAWAKDRFTASPWYDLKRFWGGWSCCIPITFKSMRTSFLRDGHPSILQIKNMAPTKTDGFSHPKSIPGIHGREKLPDIQPCSLWTCRGRVPAARRRGGNPWWGMQPSGWLEVIVTIWVSGILASLKLTVCTWKLMVGTPKQTYPTKTEKEHHRLKSAGWEGTWTRFAGG